MTSDAQSGAKGLNLLLRPFPRSPFVVLGAMVMALRSTPGGTIFVVTIPLLSVVVFGVMQDYPAAV